MKATSPKPASRPSSAVGMAAIQQIAKRVGRDHELALELWKTGWYEARLLTAFVDEADRVTAAQMDAWARDFDNWAIVDTLCFRLWDRTPHAWKKIEQWSTRRGEFQKRASFALLACVALHDKAAPDAPFVKSLAQELAASDDATARATGKTVIRELSSTAAKKRLPK